MNFQFYLGIILTLITICVVILTVYAVLVLKDLRKTLQKANGILNDAENITHIFSNPLTSIVTFVGAAVEGLNMVKSLKKTKKGVEDE